MSEHAALLAFLERPELERLWAAARAKVERLGRVAGTVRVAAASRAEREAVAGLLGLPKLPPKELAIGLDRLDRALLDSRFEIGLEQVLTLVGGPLRDLPAEREANQRIRRQLFARAGRHPVMARVPALSDWLDEVERSGLLFRLSHLETADGLLADALEVLDLLLPRRPQPTTRRLAVLANRVLGRSHGLDPGRPAATLVLAALSHLRGQPAPKTSAERRATWEWAGVVTDDLSCDVLTLGLRPGGADAVSAALRALSAAGEPARLTLRQLGSLEDAVWSVDRVRVCENPMVLALAADELGAACPPLVCLAGVPNQAGRTLLARLGGAGAELSYHGDFDWAGLRIANILLAELAWTPWRFTARDYRRALDRGVEGTALVGPSVTADWDAELADTMIARGVALEEEAVAEELLADLGS